METKLNKYLDKLEQHLQVIPATERHDIIQEIKTDMIRKSQAGMSSEDIVERFGSPKSLATSYIGNCILDTNISRSRKLLMALTFAFYVGFGALFLLPTTLISGFVFILAGVISPIAGGVKLLFSLFGTDIPQIGFYLPTHPEGFSPLVTFLMSIVFGAILFFIGQLCLKITKAYIVSVMKRKRQWLDN